MLVVWGYSPPWWGRHGGRSVSSRMYCDHGKQRDGHWYPGSSLLSIQPWTPDYLTMLPTFRMDLPFSCLNLSGNILTGTPDLGTSHTDSEDSPRQGVWVYIHKHVFTCLTKSRALAFQHKLQIGNHKTCKLTALYGFLERPVH